MEWEQTIWLVELLLYIAKGLVGSVQMIRVRSERAQLSARKLRKICKQNYGALE